MEIPSKNIQENNLYLYHYTPKYNLEFIKKYGLLSKYGLYLLKLPQFDEVFNYYKNRDKNIKTAEQLFDYLSKSEEDPRMIYFSFYPIISGLHSKRDQFIQTAILVKISLSKLKLSWKYFLIDKNIKKQITIPEIYEWCQQDSYNLQKKPGGKFAFSNIPHLGIIPTNGIIPFNLLNMNELEVSNRVSDKKNQVF